MRVVSLVPSWTETLLAAGVEVVGRTRFCVHPETTKKIPVVGGTKDLNEVRLRDLRPDLIIVDREENPREFASRLPCPYLDTHVDSIASLAAELDRLAGAMTSPKLQEFAHRARRIDQAPASPFPSRKHGFLEELAPFDPSAGVLYVIWKKPWMAVGRGTYIADVLAKLGFRLAPLPPGKYPELSDEQIRSAPALFSSEPFPFGRQVEELKTSGFAGAIVDGESFGWFGIRGLRFLESALGINE